jgi:ParB family transcriptional regulator, chromosome partitioning protein
VVERGIGRGLAAILPATHVSDEQLEQIPIDLIRPNPRQPRASFDEEALQSLADSIKAHGLLQPVLLRSRPGGGYELIAGERRWRAARIAGLDRVPAILRSSEDSERLELALIENMAREDLNPVDAARACAALVEELGLTKEEVGRRLGRSRVAISNLVRLLDLPDEVLAMLESHQLTEGHGRALLSAKDAETQRALARQARDRGLSVRETEAMARDAGSASSKLRLADPAPGRVEADAAAREAEDALTAALGCEVHVRLGRRGGKAEIPFEDLHELYELVRRLSTQRAA